MKKIDTYILLLEQISKSKKILILNSKPDGDSIGASLALNKIIKHLDSEKSVTSLSTYAIPDYLKFLAEGSELVVNEKLTTQDTQVFDLIIIVDSREVYRCLNNNVVEFFAKAAFITIDHHEKGKMVEHFNVEVVDTKTESTCGIITDICKFYKKEKDIDLIDSEIAYLLFAGIVSDTDYFGYDNVTGETFERAAYLKSYGFDQLPLIYKFRETLGLKAFQFIQRNIGKVVVNAEKKYAYLKIKKTDYAEDDNLAIVNEATNFLNRALIRIIDIVDFSFILKEISNERSSFAFRRHNNGNEVDLSKIAKKFDGGGHKQSAGGLAKMHVDSLEEEIVSYLNRTLD